MATRVSTLARAVHGRGAQRGRPGNKISYASSVQTSQDAPGKNKKWQNSEAASMAEVKGAPLRLLFAGVDIFPTAVSRTREALESHPHIRVECVAQEEILGRIHEFDMCVCRMSKFDRNLLSRATRLKLITQFGMGLEGVDIEAATEMGIKVARIPSVGTGNALSCAEHTVYLILSLLRDQKGMIKSVQEAKLGQPEGRTLFGCTVLLVGFGSIGQELAPRLKPFGVRILAVRPSWNQKYPSSADSLEEIERLQVSNGTDRTVNIVDEKGGMEHLHQFLSRSDIVVLCCPQTPKTVIARIFRAHEDRTARPERETQQQSVYENAYLSHVLLKTSGYEKGPIRAWSIRKEIGYNRCRTTPEERGWKHSSGISDHKGMVNEGFITSMKRGALLVNVARGGLLDYNTVTAALKSGQLGGLATDVTWIEPIDPKDPIIQHPSVLITPHIAGVTEMSYRTMGQLVAKSAIQLYEGKQITDVEFMN